MHLGLLIAQMQTIEMSCIRFFFLMYNNENVMKREREAGLVEGVKSEACRTTSLTASQGDVILNTPLEKKKKKMCRSKSIIPATVIISRNTLDIGP